MNATIYQSAINVAAKVGLYLSLAMFIPALVDLYVAAGLGPIIGPAGNFSTLSDPAVYLLSVMMLLGRLEILTVLVILTPLFWED